MILGFRGYLNRVRGGGGKRRKVLIRNAAGRSGLAWEPGLDGFFPIEHSGDLANDTKPHKRPRLRFITNCKAQDPAVSIFSAPLQLAPSLQEGCSE